MDLVSPDPIATSWQASLGEVMPQHIPSTVQVSHSPSLHAMSKTLDVASISPVHSLGPPRADPADLPDEVLWLQGEMYAALEQLLMTKANLNSCQRELMWNADIATCQNETQAAKAIKEAEVHHVGAIREVVSYCTATIREAETWCEVISNEAEACHATQAYTLEQSHK